MKYVSNNHYRRLRERESEGNKWILCKALSLTPFYRGSFVYFFLSAKKIVETRPFDHGNVNTKRQAAISALKATTLTRKTPLDGCCLTLGLSGTRLRMCVGGCTLESSMGKRKKSN